MPRPLAEPEILFPNTAREQKIWRADCLRVLETLPDSSADMVFTDLPYGTTGNKWDTVIDLPLMWKGLERVVKENGAMVFTAAQPFTSALVMSKPQWFKYDVAWEKTVGSGQLNISHQPLRVHETVLVFYRKKPVYHEQRTKGEPYSIQRKAGYTQDTYGRQRESGKSNDGFRHARSIIKIASPRIKGGHPTEKPVDLARYFIRTFTTAGDTVLDLCTGSGSTAEAAWKENRMFLGAEKKTAYFRESLKRLRALGRAEA